MKSAKKRVITWVCFRRKAGRQVAKLSYPRTSVATSDTDDSLETIEGEEAGNGG